MQYSIDLASQSKVKTFPGDKLMKIKRHDFSALFGGGFDFFMEYYKLAIEVRINNGFKDLLIQENTFFTSPLNSFEIKSLDFFNHF